MWWNDIPFWMNPSLAPPACRGSVRKCRGRGWMWTPCNVASGEIG
jgi:hypothetical protein